MLDAAINPYKWFVEGSEGTESGMPIVLELIARESPRN